MKRVFFYLFVLAGLTISGRAFGQTQLELGIIIKEAYKNCLKAVKEQDSVDADKLIGPTQEYMA